MSELIKEVKWTISRFEDLDTMSLYSILKLRSEIFIVEQECPYQDVDGKDPVALHLQGFYNNTLVAYCRIFKSGDYFLEASIGRVVVATAYRKFGFGHQLMNKAILLAKELLNEEKITISAQQYLQTFYESHGFLQTSEIYLEDNISHIQMKR